MVEMVEILDGRLGQHSVERVRYVINNLLHLVIVKNMEKGTEDHKNQRLAILKRL